MGILQWLFLADEEPTCLDAADANGTQGEIDATDSAFLFVWLFLGGRRLPCLRHRPASTGRSGAGRMSLAPAPARGELTVSRQDVRLAQAALDLRDAPSRRWRSAPSGVSRAEGREPRRDGSRRSRRSRRSSALLALRRYSGPWRWRSRASAAAARFETLAKGCKSCHVKYRDEGAPLERSLRSVRCLPDFGSSQQPFANGRRSALRGERSGGRSSPAIGPQGTTPNR